MDAADPRIDYLSGIDCSWSNILYGILKREGHPNRVPLLLLLSEITF
jgi:hypothetical protein